MIKKLLKTCFFLPIVLSSLEKEPWFGTIWEFYLNSSYTFSRFTKVSEARHPLKSPFNDHLFAFDLGVAPTSEWGFDADLEVVDTPKHPWGFQSAALQVRRLWLDDVAGDPISLMTGANLRGVTSKSLRDISAPYHSYANAEVSVSLGKEWDSPPFWRFRTFFLGAVGMADRGLPWVRSDLYFQYNHRDRHQWELFGLGYFGLGRRNSVNINHFDGYAHIHHQSIDIGGAYRYLFELWGSISLEYAYRVYAHSFPEHVNFVTVRYILPFSIF